jgi:hypothetical protein
MEPAQGYAEVEEAFNSVGSSVQMGIIMQHCDTFRW